MAVRGEPRGALGRPAAANGDPRRGHRTWIRRKRRSRGEPTESLGEETEPVQSQRTVTGESTESRREEPQPAERQRRANGEPRRGNPARGEPTESQRTVNGEPRRGNPARGEPTESQRRAVERKYSPRRANGGPTESRGVESIAEWTVPERLWKKSEIIAKPKEYSAKRHPPQAFETGETGEQPHG